MELGTGNYPGDAHCKLSMLENKSELNDFKSKLADNGFSISALSCHGNPLHPDQDARQARSGSQPEDHPAGRETGRPGGDRFQRLPRRFAERQMAQLGDLPLAARTISKFSSGSGTKWSRPTGPSTASSPQTTASRSPSRCIPGFVVYSPETMLRLRAIAGPSIGCNYDPSHMFWQGIDPIAAIRVLGDCIFHVHAKDTQIYERNLPLTGVLDTKSYTDERNRAWIFRTCGYGHGEEWWKEFASTLRMFGYDYVLSIEHEDSLLSPEEGLQKPRRS